MEPDKTPAGWTPEEIGIVNNAAKSVLTPDERERIKVMLIAMVCHGAIKAYCETLRDNSQKDWFEAEEWQRDSAIIGVRFALENPNAPASAQHDAWLNDKVTNGWRFGPVKDADLKEHPCIVPYEQLPIAQQKKDKLFKAIVNALK